MKYTSTCPRERKRETERETERELQRCPFFHSESRRILLEDYFIEEITVQDRPAQNVGDISSHVGSRYQSSTSKKEKKMGDVENDHQEQPPGFEGLAS